MRVDKRTDMCYIYNAVGRQYFYAYKGSLLGEKDYNCFSTATEREPFSMEKRCIVDNVNKIKKSSISIKAVSDISVKNVIWRIVESIMQRTRHIIKNFGERLLKKGERIIKSIVGSIVRSKKIRLKSIKRSIMKSIKRSGKTIAILKLIDYASKDVDVRNREMVVALR